MSGGYLIVTTSFNHQCHCVGSCTTCYYCIERSNGPIYIIHISNCIIVITLVVSLDSINCTYYVRKLTDFQHWHRSWNSSQNRIGHHLRSYDWSNNIGIDRIQGWIYHYCIAPCLSRRNEWRDNVLLTCDRINILCTVTHKISDGLGLYYMCRDNGEIQCINDTIATQGVRYNVFVYTLSSIWLVIYLPYICLTFIDCIIFSRHDYSLW